MDLEAIEAATANGPETLGPQAPHTGQLAVGFDADVITLDANPLDDIRNTNTVAHVMMNGRLYEGDTLNETWPRQRTLERR